MPDVDIETEVCINCHGRIEFGKIIEGVWTHWHGDRYCHTRDGFCNRALKQAQPPFHPAGASL